ncbi:MAG: SCO family protein [Myxococcota bacterium]
MSEKSTFLHPLWALFALLVLGLPTAALLWPERDPPDNYGAIPEFTLIDQSGASFGRADMEGSVWVTDFIFTRCPDICPVLSARMATLLPKIEDAQPVDVRLLSISVDPTYDTPPVLTEYGRKLNAPSDVWTFLTGEEQTVYGVIEGFQQLVDVQRQAGKDIPDILHSQKFVLIDGDGDIRGFYDSDPDTLESLWKDARWLLDHPEQ